MKVFKFGGASVKDAKSVRNVAEIIRKYPSDDLVIIFSAMAKTTNAFEALLEAWFYGKDDLHQSYQNIFNFHINLVEDLFPDSSHRVHGAIAVLFSEIMEKIMKEPSESFDKEYDSLVSYGELLSTSIISEYLNFAGIMNHLYDAGDLIRTDSNYREARIDWASAQKLINETAHDCFEKEGFKILISQGFIGKNDEGHRTTLGREGSDFSAAIFAYCLDAEEVIIWKDVDGLLNADPKFFRDTVKLNTISYQDAIELSYFGASVIHPRTIQPLENKKIPLRIKSFLQPEGEGSLITEHSSPDSIIPSYIFKENQVLLSIKPNDFSFIAETHLRDIYSLFSELGLKINLMQNSAISFSVCIDNHEQKLKQLINELKRTFHVKYNENLELITIRYYSDQVIRNLLQGKTILIEQRSRVTAQFVVKNYAQI